MEQKPSVGRVVHYRSYGTPDGEFKPECRAAIITEVIDPENRTEDMSWVGLAVLNPTGMYFDRDVPESFAKDGNHKGGTWHWPERV